MPEGVGILPIRLELYVNVLRVTAFVRIGLYRINYLQSMRVGGQNNNTVGGGNPYFFTLITPALFITPILVSVYVCCGSPSETLISVQRGSFTITLLLTRTVTSKHNQSLITCLTHTPSSDGLMHADKQRPVFSTFNHCHHNRSLCVTYGCY